MNFEALMEEYQVQSISMLEIYSDDSFNCRGPILPIDVVDLAKDIKTNGLQFPIAVQPAHDVKDGLPVGKKFRIIAGHRRFMAFKVNGDTFIPAMLKSGLNEVRARLVNLTENLKRADLNIVQEAEAVARLREHGLTQEAISTELGMSRTWVQVRLHLLRLPPDIKAEAASGTLNQYQIREIYALKDDNLRYAAVRRIKDARLRGEKGVSVAKKPEDDPFKKKRQTKTAVQDMLDHMANTVGYGLHTRVLAWANGVINSAELFFDIARYAEEHDIEYNCPIKVR